MLPWIVNWAEVDDVWNGALVGFFVWAGFVATVPMGALLGAWD